MLTYTPPDLSTLMALLPPERLQGMRRGIEKESLRARPDGLLALTPHPAALGSALTHPHITTDYSESQLELITGVHPSVESCLAELTEIHQATYRAMGTEPGDEGRAHRGAGAEERQQQEGVAAEVADEREVLFVA